MPLGYYEKRAARDEHSKHGYYWREYENIYAEAVATRLLFRHLRNALPFFASDPEYGISEEEIASKAYLSREPSGSDHYVYKTKLPHYLLDHASDGTLMDWALRQNLHLKFDEPVFWQDLGKMLILRYILGDNDPGSWNIVLTEGEVRTYDFDLCFCRKKECAVVEDDQVDLLVRQGMGWPMGSGADECDLEKIVKHGWEKLVCPASAKPGAEMLRLDKKLKRDYGGGYTEASANIIRWMQEGAANFLRSDEAEALLGGMYDERDTQGAPERIIQGQAAPVEAIIYEEHVVDAAPLEREESPLFTAEQLSVLADKLGSVLENVRDNQWQLLTGSDTDILLSPVKTASLVSLLTTVIETGGRCYGFFSTPREETLIDYVACLKEEKHGKRITELKKGILSYLTLENEGEALAGLEKGLKTGKNFYKDSTFGTALSRELRVG